MFSKNDKKGIWLIASVAIVVLVLFGLRWSISGRPVPGPDNCFNEPQSSTVLVFDRSEAVAGQTLAEMRARATSYIRDSVPDNGRVTVFVINDSSTRNLQPLVSLCRPRRSGNAMTENVKVLQRRYVERFQKPIDSALTQIAGSSTQSPIAEAMLDITLSRYLDAQRNSLLVFSDLLENTSSLSLYRCTGPDWAITTFKASRVGAEERPVLHNTHIYLNVIPRFGYAPVVMQCRDKFWNWFFGNDSGPDAGVETKDLPGGPRIDVGARQP